MIKHFYIFRHGETDYNLEKRWQGCGLNPDLNATGRQQAVALAQKLKPAKLEVVYSSPLRRAVQTAEVIAAAENIPLELIPNLREGCFGEAEGMLRDEIAAKWPELFTKWYNGNGSAADDLNLRFPGGESKAEMQSRMLSVLNQLLLSPYQRIGIASHGSSIRYLLMHFGYPPHKMANTALFHLIWDNGCWTLCQ